MRFLSILALTLVSLPAMAQNSFGNFEWKRDSRFEFQFVLNGRGTSIKGNLTENWPDNTEVTVEDAEQGITLYLKAFPEGFAYAVVTTATNDETGLVFIMEKKGDFYTGMLGPAIVTRKSAIMTDMVAVLEAAKKANGWDVSLALRAMRDYFEANPDSQLYVLVNAIEAGQIKTIKPRIDQSAVENGVVQLPEETARPPKIEIDETVTEQPVVEVPVEQPVTEMPVMPEEPVAPIDLGIDTPSEDNPNGLVPPMEIPESGDFEFTPPDMTQGWDGDEPVVQQGGDEPQWLIEERARQSEQRKKRRLIVDQDDDLG